jgi:hypothetical protein
VGGIHNPGRHRTVDGGEVGEHPVMLRRTGGIVVLGGSDREVDGAHVIGVPVDRIKSERIKGNCDRGGNAYHKRLFGRKNLIKQKKVSTN